MTEWLSRIGCEVPIVQAGMGGGIARHELAAAVSSAGGLGTIAVQSATAIRAELAAARSYTDKPIAVNVLLPFADRGMWKAAAESDVVVTFWGKPRRRTAGVWVHQCGSVDEARAAVSAGADAVIAQGVEAGGHVRGTTPALGLLREVLSVVAPGYPVLVAGGIADAVDVRTALEAGAAGAVAGTRFLLSEESRAHPGYKRRLERARSTIVTELFGASWAAAPHRVIPNAATRRWLRRTPRGPRAIRAANRLLDPALRRVPASVQARMLARQRPTVPLLAPVPPTDDGPESLLDSGPLYAGETVGRIDTVEPASQLVRELAP